MTDKLCWWAAMLLLISPLYGQTQSHSKSRVKYATLPLRFEPNQGQTDARVRYLARGAGYGLFVTGQGAVLSLLPQGKQSQKRPAVLSLRLKNSRPPRTVMGEQPLPGSTNYLQGPSPAAWRTGVPGYGRVTLRGVYPGVDLSFYGTQGQLEYDFLLRPGADSARIRMRLQGSQGLQVNTDGQLLIKTPAGPVKLLRPVAYQQIDGRRHPVSASYRLSKAGDIAFQVGNYDHRVPLVIDPVVSYSTFLGGSGSDGINGLAVDVQGNVYVTGTTASLDFPMASALQGSCASNCASGTTDIFVAKLNSTGSALVYATYLGGSDHDEANDIAVDSMYEVTVAGTSWSRDFPMANAAQPTCHGCSYGQSDAVVFKLQAGGTKLVFSTYLGGSSGSMGNGVANAPQGGVLVTGTTDAADFPVTGGAYQQRPAGGAENAFVTSLSDSGAINYSTYLGGSGVTDGYGIASDSTGAAYVTGFTQSWDFPVTSGVFQTSKAGGYDGHYDAFVTKLDPSGASLDYSTFFGGTGDDLAYRIAVDGQGNAAITGRTYSPDLPVSRAAQASCGSCVTNGPPDAFVAKFNAGGTALAFASYLGGSLDDQGATIAEDADGNTWVAGETGSSNFPLKDPLQNALNGGQDGFVSELDSSGGLLSSTYLGGNGGDVIYGIGTDAGGNVYVGGQTGSSNFWGNANSLHPLNAGNLDGFVARLSSTVDLAVSFTGASGTVSVGETVSGAVQISNQGSDAASGVTLSLSAAPNLLQSISASASQGSCTGSGAISCTLGTLAPGATATVQLSGSAVNGGTLTLTASAQARQNDTNTTNNAANATLTVNNPVPQLSSVTPDQAAAGSTGVALTLAGSGFTPSSVVNWNSAALATTFVSPTELQASVPAADSANIAQVSVTVVNPAPGGGTSAALPFQLVGNTPPFGWLDMVANFDKSSATIAQYAPLLASGWAVDAEDGAPVRRVDILIDGQVVGQAELGKPRPDVASAYGRSDYADSGWSFKGNIGGLTAGTHQVTAVATDSAGATSTLGSPLTITVTGNSAPFGFADGVWGAATGKASVAQFADFTMSGWAVDAEDGAPVQRVDILIDGQVVGQADLGKPRPDVASAYGRSDYAKSGWSFRYNVGGLAAGTHQVKAVATDSVGAASELGAPLTLTVTGNSAPFGIADGIWGAATGTASVAQFADFTMSGWAVDAEDGAPVQRVDILIDGQVVGQADLGKPRPDVASAYGRSDYAKSGWSFRNNVGGLAAGTHQVKVVATDSAGAASELGAPLTITVTGNSAPFGFADGIWGAATGTASVAQFADFTMSGWAVDAEDGAPVQRVDILIDGQVVGQADLGKPRPDVASAYGRSDYANSGWSFRYNVGGLAAGTHQVKAVATDSVGAASELGAPLIFTVTGNSVPYGFVEGVRGAATGTASVAQYADFTMSGWAVDTEDGAPVAQIQIRIDNQPFGLATLGKARSDVAAYLGNSRYTNAGWSFSGNIGGLTPGSHSVTAWATDSTGATVQIGALQTMTVTANTPPFGVVEVVANPANGSTNLAQYGTLQVSGWAVDAEDGSPIHQVEIRIDGNSVGTAALGGTRSDVASALGRSDYAHAGWTFSTNIGSLAPGSHAVTVIARDNSGGEAAIGGTHTIAVSANGAPFGHIDDAVNANDGSSTLPQFTNLQMSGWAVDPEDGAPLTRIDLEIDGTIIGQATLGVARPDVASYLGNSKDLSSGWIARYNIGNLAPGTHTLKAVGWDSVGGSASIGAPQVFTVTPNSISVALDASSVSVPVSHTRQFAARVSGDPTNSVLWSVNGVAGGNATIGTISGSGLYTAPANVPNPSVVTITAASVADSTKSASASATVVSGSMVYLTIPQIPADVTNGLIVVAGGTWTRLNATAGQQNFTATVAMPNGSYEVRVIGLGTGGVFPAVVEEGKANVTVSGIVPVQMTLSQPTITLDSSTPAAVSAGGTYTVKVNVTDPGDFMGGPSDFRLVTNGIQNYSPAVSSLGNGNYSLTWTLQAPTTTGSISYYLEAYSYAFQDPAGSFAPVLVAPNAAFGQSSWTISVQ